MEYKYKIYDKPKPKIKPYIENFFGVENVLKADSNGMVISSMFGKKKSLSCGELYNSWKLKSIATYPTITSCCSGKKN